MPGEEAWLNIPPPSNAVFDEKVLFIMAGVEAWLYIPAPLPEEALTLIVVFPEKVQFVTVGDAADSFRMPPPRAL